MSITQIQAIPTGTWSADKVHSNVAFAVDYMAGTFQGSFANFEAEARDGVLTGSRSSFSAIASRTKSESPMPLRWRRVRKSLSNFIGSRMVIVMASL